MLRLDRARAPRGYSMLEAVAVLVVLGLLSSLTYFAYTKINTNSQDSRAEMLLRSVTDAQQVNYLNRGSFAVSATPAAGEEDAEADQVAANDAGYVDAGTEPVKPHQVSIGQGRAYGSVPVLGVATLSESGNCVLRVAYAPRSGRKAAEKTLPSGAVPCTAASAFVELGTETKPDDVDLPGKVTNLAVVAGPGRLNLSWDAVPDAGGYHVYRLGPGETQARYLANVTGAATHADTGLAATAADGTAAVYEYTVVAYNDAGSGAASDPVSGTPEAAGGTDEAPTSPWDLRVVEVTDAGVLLTWNPGRNTSKFTITRDGSPLVELSDHDNTYTTTYLDATVVDGAKYTYRVTGYNPAGDGGTETSATVTATTPPPAPTSLIALPRAGKPNPGGCDSPACVDLSWSTPPNPPTIEAAPADSYRIYRCEAATCPTDPEANLDRLTQVATVPATRLTYTDSGLPAETDYVYVIASRNSGGVSFTGTPAAITTLPQRVTGLTGTAAAGEVTLNWAASSTTGLAGYQIWTTNRNGEWTLLGVTSGATTSYTHVLEADPPVVIRYRVAAVSDRGPGLPSAAVDITTRPTTPYLSGDITRKHATLTWTERANVATYQLERRSATDTTWNAIASGLSGGTYIDETITSSTGWYEYRLRATGTDSTVTTSPALRLRTVPGPARNLTGKLSSDGTYNHQHLRLSWDANPNVDSWVVKMCDTAMSDGADATSPVCGAGTEIARTTGGAATLDLDLNLSMGPLAHGTRYSFFVHPAGATDAESLGRTIALRTKPGLPQLLKMVSVVDSETYKPAGFILKPGDSSAARYLIYDYSNPANPTVLATIPHKGAGNADQKIEFRPGTQTSRWTVLRVVAENESGSTRPAEGLAYAAYNDRVTPAPPSLRVVDGKPLISWSAPNATTWQLRRCAWPCDPATDGVLLPDPGGVNPSTGGYVDTHDHVSLPTVYAYSLRIADMKAANGRATWTEWSEPGVLTLTPSTDGITPTLAGSTMTFAGLPGYATRVVAELHDVAGNPPVTAQAPASGGVATLTLEDAHLVPGRDYELRWRFFTTTGVSSYSPSTPVTTPTARIDLYLDSSADGHLTFQFRPFGHTDNYTVVGCAGTTDPATCDPAAADMVPMAGYHDIPASSMRLTRIPTGEVSGGEQIYEDLWVIGLGINDPAWSTGVFYVATTDATGAVVYSEPLAYNRSIGKPSNFHIQRWDLGSGAPVPVLCWTRPAGTAGLPARVYTVNADGSHDEVAPWSPTTNNCIFGRGHTGNAERTYAVTITDPGGAVSPAATLIAVPVPATPTDAPAVARGDRGWILDWSDARGAGTRYQLTLHEVDPNSPTTILNTLSTVTLEASGTDETTSNAARWPWEAGKKYAWSYRAFNDTTLGYSGYSPLSTAVTPDYRQVAVNSDAAEYFTFDQPADSKNPEGYDLELRSGSLANFDGSSGSSHLVTPGYLGTVPGLHSSAKSRSTDRAARVPESHSGSSSVFSGRSGAADEKSTAFWYKSLSYDQHGGGTVATFLDWSLSVPEVRWTDLAYDWAKARPSTIGGTDYAPQGYWVNATAAQRQGDIDHATAILARPLGDGSTPNGVHRFRKDFTLDVATTGYLHSYCPNNLFEGDTSGPGSPVGAWCEVWVDGQRVRANRDGYYGTRSSAISLAPGEHSIAAMWRYDGDGSTASFGFSAALRSANSATATPINDAAGKPIVSGTDWKGFGALYNWQRSYQGENASREDAFNDPYFDSSTLWSGSGKMVRRPSQNLWQLWTRNNGSENYHLAGDRYVARGRYEFRNTGGTYYYRVMSQNAGCRIRIDGGSFTKSGSTYTRESTPAFTCTDTAGSIEVPPGAHTITLDATAAANSTTTAPSVGFTLWYFNGSKRIVMMHNGGGARALEHDPNAGEAFDGPQNNNNPNWRAMRSLQVGAAPLAERGSVYSGRQSLPKSTVEGEPNGQVYYPQLNAQRSNRSVVFSRDGGPSYEHLLPGNGLLDQQWHHVAVTGDQTKATVYVDGTQIRSISGTPTHSLVGLGAKFTGATSRQIVAGSAMPGLYDEWAWWRRTLSAGEIANLIAAAG